jgi:hypothetical protein
VNYLHAEIIVAQHAEARRQTLHNRKIQGL